MPKSETEKEVKFECSPSAQTQFDRVDGRVKPRVWAEACRLAAADREPVDGVVQVTKYNVLDAVKAVS